MVLILQPKIIFFLRDSVLRQVVLPAVRWRTVCVYERIVIGFSEATVGTVSISRKVYGEFFTAGPTVLRFETLLDPL